jgi:hypothetical protein
MLQYPTSWRYGGVGHFECPLPARAAAVKSPPTLAARVRNPMSAENELTAFEELHRDADGRLRSVANGGPEALCEPIEAFIIRHGRS